MNLIEQKTMLGSEYIIFQNEIFLTWGLPCKNKDFYTPADLAMCKEMYVVPYTSERHKFLKLTTETNYWALRDAMLEADTATEMEALTLKWNQEEVG